MSPRTEAAFDDLVTAANDLELPLADAPPSHAGILDLLQEIVRQLSERHAELRRAVDALIGAAAADAEQER
jgi:hypothetical protein